MIQAHELRIGNLVNFTYRHKKEYLSRPVRVTEIRTDYVMTDDKGLPLQLHYNGGSISPIPLSPEILEKCGFVESKGFGWDLEDSRFSLDITFTPAWREVICSPNRIKYLHQLQNLYFALTGEELTLNL